MSLLRRRDDEAEREALEARVHGVTRCCGLCGTVGQCDPEDVIIRRDLNGRDVLYGRCRTCARIPAAVLDRTVAARLLATEVDSLVLDGLRVTRFADRPVASPDHPDAEPWGHVDVEALAELADRNRTRIEHRVGGPCSICGATLTPLGTSWTTVQGSGLAQCGRCSGWLDGTQYSPEGVRVLAASVLLGQSTPTERRYGPPGLSTDTGFLLFAATGRKRGTAEPWGWLDPVAQETILAKAWAHGAESIDTRRWLLIDRHLGRRRR